MSVNYISTNMLNTKCQDVFKKNNQSAYRV